MAATESIQRKRSPQPSKEKALVKDKSEKASRKEREKASRKEKGKDKSKEKRKEKERSKDKHARAKSKAKAKQKTKAQEPAAALGADKYALYQEAVNSPDTDVDFLMDAYKRMRGRKPRHLREDFCGTASLAAEWISRGSRYTAEGFDIDSEPVEWGKEHNFQRLGKDIERMTFHLADVRQPSSQAPDVRTAANFSYWLFTTRAEMLDYFQRARKDLAEEGIFVIDLYGGPEAMTEMEEERDLPHGVTYVWDQAEYWPGSGEYRCSIHFRFRDGSMLEDCFRYNWRLWTMPELRDLLYEAGFQVVDSYFEGTDEDGESGNGIFEKDHRGENCEAWLGYLVAAD